MITTGDRVTMEPLTYFDGRPLEGWPSPEHVGTVLRFHSFRGARYVWISFPNGRKTWTRVSDVTILPVSLKRNGGA